ncbi:MAG: glycoside hydrolase family 15 protein [Desulfobacterales bacterium]
MENLNVGVIGNCTSGALVDTKGSIVWCCLPGFDSQAVFAKILDPEHGGEFAIRVDDGYSTRMAYQPNTNILVTAFSKGADQFEVLDFMPRYRGRQHTYHCPPDIIRFIRHKSGRPTIRVHYQPRPCFGQYAVKTEVRQEYIKTGTVNGSYESVYLYSDLDLESIAASRPIVLDRSCYLLLSYNQKLIDLNLDYIQLEYQRTRVYWMNWSTNTRRFALYNTEIQRSALVLKLLACQKSGAILAALTTSLPEEIGAERNWDYRFCWLRDASMTIAVLTKLGHHNVARRFFNFILDIIPYKDEQIQIMYGINGEKQLTERILGWLKGYERSRPVRVGNAAYTQKQNDIYGVLLDAIYEYLIIFKRETVENRENLWTVVRTLARHVEKSWDKKDSGIWEFRTSKKHFTFSKVLSWVAMDRAMHIAAYFGRPNYVAVWYRMGNKIKASILAKGWDPQLKAFTQIYGEPHLDAANLLMEHYGFIQADDPKYISTVRLTYEQLSRDGLMYRYRNADDFGVPATSFTVCTFWLIKSLYKIGEIKAAMRLFEQVLSYANPVGLFSEGIDFATKRLLGNFPQAYSHLALIDAAITFSGEDILPDEYRH